MSIRHRPFTVGVEIEAEWSTMHYGNIVGDALRLPFRDATFNGLISSPCYGNRFADHHNAQDGSVRRSYTHDLGRPLHDNNSGSLQWGDDYRAFHHQAWSESLRVLERDALIVVNVSNHIRRGEEQLVTEWHLNWFLTHGCKVVDLDRVCTNRFRYGENRQARVRYENILVLRLGTPVYTPVDLEESNDDGGEQDIAPVRPGVSHHLDPADGGRVA
jgi:hypothetical protein